ncbi:hypothetical protein HZB96_05670 [Candidatus Gottesmanbacteria bacterium]|nr:hypothetical protein [Candidatus Gottesmanbacteria bacterium]
MMTVTVDELYPLISSHDLVKYAKLFHKDIVMALSNQPSSLPCILNPIHKLSPHPGFGVAVSVGGTNGYVSAFRINGKGVLKFLNRKLFFLPEQTTRDSLFHLITKNILSVAGGKKKSFPIGIGFAYPLKPVLTHHFVDGELLYMSKGRNIAGLVGKRVGQEYHKFLIKEYGIDTIVSVANDAICLLLGGDGVDIAGVVGTGLNFAYWEKRSAVAPLKLGELNRFSQGEVAVNLEAKNFDKIVGTKLREIVDRKSDDRGYSLAEKEAAGAYLYQIFNAGRDKIVGKNFPELSSSDQLNEIITISQYSPGRSNFVTPSRWPNGLLEGESLKSARLFAERIFHRSAQIVAIEICGILMKLKKTKGIVPIVMEGGIFWKAKNYHALVNMYINTILPEVIPSFARLFGSSRRGIAILARSSD